MVSPNTKRVFSSNRASTSWSVMSSVMNRAWMPMRFMVTANRLMVPP